MVSKTSSFVQFVRTYYGNRPDCCANHVRNVIYTAEQLNSFTPALRPAQLTEDLLGRFLDSLDCSPVTKCNKRACLLAVWRAAWEHGLTEQPPRPKRIPKPKIPDPVPEAFTLEEMRTILHVTSCLVGLTEGIPSNLYWGSLLRVCYETGGRIGSIMQTRPSDFNTGARWLILRSTTDKTGRSHYYQLTPETTQAIAATNPDRRSLLWPWSKSQCWLLKVLQTKILDPAGVSYGRARGGVFHKFRRTAGTLVEANGGDGSRLLGNTRRVFERHYLDSRAIGNGQSQFLPPL